MWCYYEALQLVQFRLDFKELNTRRYSLSPEAQTTTIHLFTTLSFVAETFVFVYLVSNDTYCPYSQGINVSNFSLAFKAMWDPVLLVIGLISFMLHSSFSLTTLLRLLYLSVLQYLPSFISA